MLAFALSLGACADMDWTRPGADKAAVSRDLDECRGRALRGSPPEAAGRTQDPQLVDRGANPNTGRTSNERFIAEHDAVRQCMVGRGYQLTPAR